MKKFFTRKDRFLMLYVRKNMYLAIILSLGALIFVSALSATGSFSYILQKQSTYLAIDEFSVDVIVSQDHYEFYRAERQVPPYCICEAINSTLHVKNVTCLAIMKLEADITTNRVNKGVDTILILGLWTRESINLTLSQGSSPSFSQGSYEPLRKILVSQDFFYKYDVVTRRPVKLNSTSGWLLSGSAVGVTSLTFSQLIEHLGIYDSLSFAGYDAAKLTMLNQYPFVVTHIQTIFDVLMWKKVPPLFFVKFVKEAFANPWDIDITIANLKEVGEDLLLTINNASSQRAGIEVKAASIKSWPTPTILQELSGFISINRLTVFSFGFTIAVIGWYFYGMLSQAVIAAKKGEFQLIRVRGASGKSVAKSIGFILVVAGITGTILGISLGYLFTVTLTPSILGISITKEDLSMTFNVPSLLLYGFFGLAASLLSQRKVFSQMSVSPQEERTERTEASKSLAETISLLIAFGLGAVKAASWIFGFKISWEGQTTNPATSAVLLFIRLLDRTILDTLGPLLLTYALVNLVSMRPKILSTVSYAISHGLSPSLALLSKKIMHNKSVKMVGGMIIISLLIFNVVSVHMGHAGIETAWTSLSIAVVGADVRVDIKEEVAPCLFQVLNNMTDLGGYMQIVGVETALGTPLANTMTYMVNSTEYTTLIDGIDEPLANTLKSLSDVEIIVSEFFHDVGVLDRGDLVKLEDRELLVVDFIGNLPGTLSIPALERFSVVDVKALQGVNYIILSRTVIINAGQWYPEDVVEEIVKNLPNNMNQSYTVATRASAISQFSRRMSISLIVENVMSLLFVASLLTVAFAVAAIGAWAYNEAKVRRAFDALLRIRGVTRRQLLSMILSETFTFFLFASIIGFFAGYVMASGYTAYFSSAFPVNASPAISYDLVAQLLTLLGTYLLLSLAPSMYAMTKTARLHAH